MIYLLIFKILLFIYTVIDCLRVEFVFHSLEFNEEARGTLPFWGTSVNSYNQQQDSHVPQTAHPQVPEVSMVSHGM